MTVIRAGVLLLVLAGFSLAFSSLTANRIPVLVLPDTGLPAPQHEPVTSSEFISDDQTQEVHSATAVELPNGDIRVFWYGGTREGSKDTSIYTRVLSEAQGSWSDIDKIITRQQVASDTRRYIRKLGNPVAVASGNEVRLFFVTTSIGGWATSAINLSVSADNGKTWGEVSRLISSPLINVLRTVAAGHVRQRHQQVPYQRRRPGHATITAASRFDPCGRPDAQWFRQAAQEYFIQPQHG
jgi:predicted neuraminidase